jgi:hypothetical protein
MKVDKWAASASSPKMPDKRLAVVRPVWVAAIKWLGRLLMFSAQAADLLPASAICCRRDLREAASAISASAKSPPMAINAIRIKSGAMVEADFIQADPAVRRLRPLF